MELGSGTAGCPGVGPVDNVGESAALSTLLEPVAALPTGVASASRPAEAAASKPRPVAATATIAPMELGSGTARDCSANVGEFAALSSPLGSLVLRFFAGGSKAAPSAAARG